MKLLQFKNYILLSMFFLSYRWQKLHYWGPEFLHVDGTTIHQAELWEILVYATVMKRLANQREVLSDCRPECVRRRGNLVRPWKKAPFVNLIYVIQVMWHDNMPISLISTTTVTIAKCNFFLFLLDFYNIHRQTWNVLYLNSVIVRTTDILIFIYSSFM